MTRPALVRRVFDAPATRPALTVYVAAVLLGAAAARPAELIRWDVAAALLLGVVVLVILASMHREVVKVHLLVNSQRDELVARIEQLTAALTDAGAQVPNEPGGGGR